MAVRITSPESAASASSLSLLIGASGKSSELHYKKLSGRITRLWCESFDSMGSRKGILVESVPRTPSAFMIPEKLTESRNPQFALCSSNDFDLTLPM